MVSHLHNKVGSMEGLSHMEQEDNHHTDNHHQPHHMQEGSLLLTHHHQLNMEHLRLEDTGVNILHIKQVAEAPLPLIFRKTS
jgi:hypothetical protein